jgi:hypothetical protein
MMLMNHMSGLNALIMEHIGRLSRANTLDGIELYERTLNKLCRTFASYVDVLHRCYRSGGEQRVMVQQNVSVKMVAKPSWPMLRKTLFVRLDDWHWLHYADRQS